MLIGSTRTAEIKLTKFSTDGAVNFQIICENIEQKLSYGKCNYCFGRICLVWEKRLCNLTSVCKKPAYYSQTIVKCGRITYK
jgi:hypothetical protein